MKNYQYCYLMAMLMYIAAKVSEYAGLGWGILGCAFWVCGIVLCCKNK